MKYVLIGLFCIANSCFGQGPVGAPGAVSNRAPGPGYADEQAYREKLLKRSSKEDKVVARAVKSDAVIASDKKISPVNEKLTRIKLKAAQKDRLADASRVTSPPAEDGARIKHEQLAISILNSRAKALVPSSTARPASVARLQNLTDSLDKSTLELSKFRAGASAEDSEDRELIEILLISSRAAATQAFHDVSTQSPASEQSGLGAMEKISQRASIAAARVSQGIPPFERINVTVSVSNQDPAVRLKVYAIPADMASSPELYDDRLEDALRKFSFSQSPSPSERKLPGDARFLVWVGADFLDKQMADLIRKKSLYRTKMVDGQAGKESLSLTFPSPGGITLISGAGK